jgi:hypothetical protein
MPRLRVAPWLRRAIEAAIAAAILAVGFLFGEGLSTGGQIYPVPSGVPGMLVLAPPVLALAVITVAYPVMMAATRSDALMGAVAAFLIAADATIVVASAPFVLEGIGRELRGGVLVALLALLPALVGLAGGQFATPLGFGRRAGAIGAIVAAATAIAIILVVGVVAI